MTVKPEVYGGTAFIKERINLNALKLLENFSWHACHCDALVIFVLSRSCNAVT